MAKREIPQVVQECNVFINGKGYLGVTKSLKLPTFEFETMEVKGAMGAEVSTGVLKATEIEFKIQVLDTNLFLSTGLNTYANRVPFLFKASVFQSGKMKKVPLSLAITGDIKAVELPELESSKEMEVTVKMSAHFVNLNIDGVPVILKDVENMICIIGGVDHLAQTRTNLGE
ncbi:phage tail protein [Aliarcobacter skirrowii]|uniref:phage major tail tube protein n=1 Tax=Aliarcobacter skirrowii TaxID=28200 RepID=UPI00100B1161|nr:phage major tail tube protein [Aliarcobacter skirrowii]RXJ80817.1 phage tail protein [Aliarcobacter skirrowii]